MRSLYDTRRTVQALLAMIAEGGASAAGEMPPVEYVTALLDVGPEDSQAAAAVAQAHREGRSPPAHSNAGRGGN